METADVICMSGDATPGPRSRRSDTQDDIIDVSSDTTPTQNATSNDIHVIGEDDDDDNDILVVTSKRKAREQPDRCRSRPSALDVQEGDDECMELDKCCCRVSRKSTQTIWRRHLNKDCTLSAGATSVWCVSMSESIMG